MNGGLPSTNQLAAGLDFRVVQQIRCRDDPVQVGEYLLDHHRVFNTGNDVHGRTNAAGAWMRRSGDLDGTTAFTARFKLVTPVM